MLFYLILPIIPIIMLFPVFRIIDGQQKEAGKKLYKLGGFRFLLIHCGLETKSEWPPPNKAPSKVDPVNKRTISGLALWLQIINILYLIYFYIIVLIEIEPLTYISFSIYVAYPWLLMVYIIVFRIILDKKAKKLYLEKQKKLEKQETLEKQDTEE